MSKSQTPLTFSEVVRRLNQSIVPWAVFSGAAASVYGATRPITDIDILILTSAGDQVAGLFPEARVTREDDGTVTLIQLPGFDILAGLIRHNAYVSFSLELDAEMKARLTHHKINGISVPVVPPEDNILLKAILGRGPEKGKHDWEDVEAMLNHLSILDWAYLCRRAKACGPSHRMKNILKRLESLGHLADGELSSC